MSGVQLAAAVVDLVNFSRQCLDLYQEARLDTNESRNSMRLHLEVEAIRFDRWCDAIGVRDMVKLARDKPDDWKKGDELVIFGTHLQRTLRFESEMVASLVISVLKSLKATFQAARGRLPQERSEEVPVDIDSPKRFSLWKRRTSRDPKQPPTAFQRARKSSTDLLAAGKFLLWDKKVFDRLLSDVTSINETLIKLVGTDIQAQIRRRVEIESLGNQLVDHGSSERLAHAPDTNDIAQLRGIRDQMDSLDANPSHTLFHDTAFSSNSSWTRIPRFQVQDFARDTLTSHTPRSASTLRDSAVLVEWRYHSNARPLDFDQGLRLAALVTQLGRNKFHVPYCRGIVKDQDNSRVGLVFSIPHASKGTRWVHRDLHGRIGATPNSRPSLGQLFSIAFQLSIALHQFQTVHWLHKSLRSDNIVCFEEVARPTATNGVKAADRGNTENQKLPLPLELPTLPPFYLLGLDISRPDHPSELSESISVSKSGYHERSNKIELYSHPDIFTLDENGSKQRYRSQYDIYSFGLILLEIGLWRTLDDLKAEAKSSISDFRQQAKTIYCDQLQSSMGEMYWRATRRCLFDDFDLGDSPAGAEAGTALQLAFEKQVVSELERCKA